MPEMRKSANNPQKLGIFFELDSPMAMECVALSGFDYAIVDLEHGPLAVNNAVELICRGRMRGMPVFVRPQDASRSAILKSLDAGADGLVVPGIQCLEGAAEAVSYGKYPPVGNRGVAMTRAASFGYDPAIPGLPQLFTVKNRETQLFLQCETLGCLEAIEEIAALNGVDGIFIGPYDLSTDMGIAGQFEHERMKAAFSRIKAACRAAGKPVLIFAPSAHDAEIRLHEGYDSVAVSTLSAVLVDGCRNLIARSRGEKG